MFGSNGVTALPNAAIPSNTSSVKQTRGIFGTSGDNAPSAIAFVVIIVLYLVWALVQQHQKVKDQIQPKNIALNFHNLFAVALQVIVALGLIKLLLVLAGKFNIPGTTEVSNAVEFAS
jgi:hypothetical protein